jgi:aspartate aminotransferase-like enzyme
MKEGVNVSKEFTLFSVGPVEIEPNILELGSKPIPYFRTQEFSDINLGICSRLKKIAQTKEDSEVVLLTCSGTGAMEAAVINIFNEKDKLLVIDGGSFGDRFREICEIHEFNYSVIKLELGKTLTKETLWKYKGKGYTGLLVNVHETSTGVLYDMKMIGEFCKQEGITLIADAISSFLADQYYMDRWGIDVTIVSSQKALALPPGISIMIINKETADKIKNNKVKSMYFNLVDYFDNMKRGQTPFTPAVGIFLQLDAKLKQIEKLGLNEVLNKTKFLAEDFRRKIKDLPLTIPSESLSYSMTPLHSREGVSAYGIYEYLVKNYSIYVCPNGGNLKDKIFRVGHMGNLTIEDNDLLVNALCKMNKEGLL